MEMEMELGTFPLPELGQTSMNLSSLFDSADIYTPTFADQLPAFPMIDDHQFQSNDMSHFGSDSFSTNSTDSFLLDFHDFHHLIPFDTCISSGAMPAIAPSEIEKDECDQFLNDDLLGLVAPIESEESFIDHILASASTSTTTNSSEMDVNPAALETDATTMRMVLPQNQEYEEEEESDEDPKPSTLNCKNLYSERNRRKRLSQQLLALRSLVPNITKMDKRSVLVDALAYLRGIQEETVRIETELKEGPSFYHDKSSNSNDNNTLGSTLPPQITLTPKSRKTKAQILEIDTERIEDRRFVVKITCKGGPGVGGEVLRVIESLGFEITYIALEQIKPMHVLTTVFIRARKQGRMTEEKLKDSITSMALRSGLMFQNP
ncbi:transcription factor FER-LIKE IRON DEFICIENCY-INDUCED TRANSCRIPTION FACTOR-like [Magnolia sinica]|uniref:transcription factor FER-LIKE IRON DEFICIENCY-INDUCED TRANSCRIPTION FACTOR-like n=1 Tax=Magnolia sinica TaxID=86752 RepID=UPI00265AE950|nr:transcription factor FER-LIKE IRON DEFICIENCY-INDUCED TRANSCRIPTION FACTOR-like [Magnolia sinica]